jgi:hypothetical protein
MECYLEYAKNSWHSKSISNVDNFRKLPKENNRLKRIIRKGGNTMTIETLFGRY